MPRKGADARHVRLLSAAHFAADKHRYQKRKDPEASPYINHPISVAELLATVGGVTDLAVLQAAILHDTLEDTRTTRRELTAKFGARVSRLVAEVTDDKKLPKKLRKQRQIEHAPELSRGAKLPKKLRKQRQIEHAPHLSRGAKLIKLGDKISNVFDVLHSPPAKWDAARRLQYIAWSRRVVDGCRGVNAALERHFDRLAKRAEAAVRATAST